MNKQQIQTQISSLIQDFCPIANVPLTYENQLAVASPSCEKCRLFEPTNKMCHIKLQTMLLQQIFEQLAAK